MLNIAYFLAEKVLKIAFFIFLMYFFCIKNNKNIK